jgi:geranylgeranyl pyrophosphate synthase
MSLPQSQSNQQISPGERIERWRGRFEPVLARLLPTEDGRQQELHRAMRYAALNGGKRIRPALVYATGLFLGIDDNRLDRAAAAIEMIHAYSLIHDDLPAMDDDDMRRGRPSVHRAFDEATAILAGDALQALAFQIIAEDSANPPQARLEIVMELARACGSMGMAGGQDVDLKAVGTILEHDDLEAMHSLKTGALIQLCLTAPASLASCEEAEKKALAEFGSCIGLAFQIHDDILDVVGESETMGKPTQGDRKKGKPTFPSTLGLEQSRQRASELRDRALAALEPWPGDSSALTYLANYVVVRDR